MLQEYPSIHTLKAEYEYDSLAQGKKITQRAFKHFILPCWTQLYPSEDDKDGCNYLNMLDVRTGQFNSDSTEFKWSEEDQVQLDEMELIEHSNIMTEVRNDNGEMTQGRLERAHYITQAIQLTHKRKAFLKMMNQLSKDEKQYILDYLIPIKSQQLGKDKSVNHQSFPLKVYIFQRIHIVNKKHFLKKEYFLINFNINEKTQRNAIWPIIDSSEKNEEKGQKINLAYSFEVKKNFFMINVDLDSQFDLLIGEQMKERYEHIPENKNLKLLKMTFTITDKEHFFTKELQCAKRQDVQERQWKIFKNVYYWIEPVLTRNRIVYPFQECKFQKTKLYLSQNFHLAFQGGGAKGLAYVGAYKAIQEQKCKNLYEQANSNPRQIPIPIKSIMGSSAGGIIALGISTGIPDYELQKICYKMNSIPSTDRFRQLKEGEQEDQQYKAIDEYGQELKKETVIDNFKKLLDTEGILKEETSNHLLNKFSNYSKLETMEDKALEYLAAKSPAIAEILTNLGKKETVTISTKKWTNPFSWFNKSVDIQIQRKKINLEGLLLHGALMKGQAIHDIAKDCMVKFFIKRQAQMKQQDFTQYLKRCLSSQNLEESEGLEDKLRNHFKLSRKIFQQTKLNDLKGILSNKNPNAYSEFVVALLNNFIILIDSFKKQEPGSDQLSGLNIQTNTLNMQKLPLRDAEEYKDLVSYFRSTQKKRMIQKIEVDKQERNVINQTEIAEQKANVQIICNKQNEKLPPAGQPITYSHFNSIVGETCLIDVEHWKSGNQGQQSTCDYISSIFQAFEADRFVTALIEAQQGQQNQSLNNLFYALECAQTINRLFQTITGEQQANTKQLFKQYNRNIKEMKDIMGRINMMQYYRMTGIELSCTSVDLDNKVLRFFNQKTTPSLPVCKAVQMTGSFPVGFKAQRWKSQWGSYNIYSQEQRTEVDITNHQFTDGGLLANFPIKYMDNEEIRKTYFSHKTLDTSTILLGFGLDYLDSSRYHMTEKQLAFQKQITKKSQIARQQIMSQMGVLEQSMLALSTWWNSTSQVPITVQWSQISHHLIQEIPLFRFLNKISHAYPNADRNLNLEAFKEKLISQEIQPSWLTFKNFKAQKDAQQRSCMLELMDQYHLHFKNIYTTQPILDYQEQEFQLQYSQRKEEIMTRTKTMKESFLSMIKDQGILALSVQNLNQNRKPPSQRQLSLRLIKMFFLHLHLPENEFFLKRYSEIYIFLKYVSGQIQFAEGKRPQIRTSKEVDLKKHINRINFQCYYDDENFKEIASRLSFQDFDSTYWSGFAQKMKENESMIEEYQNGREPIYQKYKKEIRKETLDKVAEYKQDFLYERDVFNKLSDLYRITQLIYLMIKCRDNQRLRSAKQCREIAKILKKTKYGELLYCQQEQNPPAGQIRFAQLLTFMNDEMKEWRIMNQKDKRVNIKLTTGFKILIQESNPDTTTKQKGINLLALYFYSFIRQCDASLVGINEQANSSSISQSLRRYAYDEYFFTVLNKNAPELFKLMRRYYIKGINQELQSQKQVGKIKQLNQKRFQRTLYSTSQSVYEQIYGKKAQFPHENQLKKIQQLLLFLCDKNFDVEKLNPTSITTGKKQKIKYLIRQTWNFLFFNQYQQFLSRQISATQKYKQFNNPNTFSESIFKKLSEQFRLQPLKNEIAASLDAHVNQAIQPSMEEINNWKVIDNSMKLIEIDSMKCFLESKLQKTSIYNSNVKQTSVQQSIQIANIIEANNSYFNDLETVFYTLKMFIFLTSRAQAQKFQNIAIKNTIQELNRILLSIFESIFETFPKRYSDLILLPINQISLQKIKIVFTIDYNIIEKLTNEVYPKIDELHGMSRNQPSFKQMKWLKEKLISRKKSLPSFDIESTINLQARNQRYKHKLADLFILQEYYPLDHFAFPLNKQPKLDDEDEKKKSIGSNVHLVLEGIANSHEYLAGLYMTIDKLVTTYDKNNGNEEQNQKIKMITCSNFHSIFGFLLSMGYSIEDIRIEMLGIESLIICSENFNKINRYFQGKQWLSNTAQSRKQLLRYLEKQQTDLFTQVEELKGKRYSQVSLQTEVKGLKLIYQHEKHEMLETYMKILDETAENIEYIDFKFQMNRKPLEIAQRFGFDFICNMNETHQYSKEAQNTKKQFIALTEKLFPSFADLLYGYISNCLTQQCNIYITKQNAKEVAKGLMIEKLLTTYKLKDYITNKLKAEGLSSRISLKQYYEVSRRKILLNFTVINTTEKRMAFLNKNSRPNMPIWAAILASSSLPFYHKYFEGNKQWEATTSSDQFYDFFLSDFFVPNKKEDNRYVSYTSANIVSSLPLELLTNENLKSKILMDDDDADYDNMKIVGVSFQNYYQYKRTVDIDVKKNYLQLTGGTIASLAAQKLGSKIKSGVVGAWNWLRNKTPWKNFHEMRHKNNTYIHHYSKIEGLTRWLNQSKLVSTTNILVNSNDNLIMKWYQNQLIKLPIKIDTLEFDAIIDKKLFAKYHVNVLSEKASESIERSLQITNSFIYDIGDIEGRYSLKRFEVKARIELIQKSRQYSVSGFKRHYYKLSFLNHSQWNKNLYNNFKVEYFVNDQTDLLNRKATYKQMEESQIFWLTEDNSEIYLKFYYVFREEDEIDTTSIKFTQFQLDFKNIIKQLPLKSSYDYHFVFGWKKGTVGRSQVSSQLQLQSNKYVNYRPVKRNGFKLPRRNNEPALRLKLVEKDDNLNTRLFERTSKIVVRN